jgi:hypothetical protein
LACIWTKRERRLFDRKTNGIRGTSESPVPDRLASDVTALHQSIDVALRLTLFEAVLGS